MVGQFSSRQSPGRSLSQLGPVPIRAAILQGWLRSLEEGTEVQPLPLRALPLPLVDGIAGFDLLVASREDLVAERIAVESYSEIIRNLGDDDPTTRIAMEAIMSKEEEHADDMKTLLERLGHEETKS